MSIRSLSNGSWEVSLFLPGNQRDNNKRFRRRYPDKKTAEGIDFKLRAARATGTLQSALQELDGHTQFAGVLADLMDRYWKEYVVVHNRTFSTKKYRIGVLKKSLGRIGVGDFSPSHLSNYIQARKKLQKANATINREIGVLHHIFAWAVEQRLMESNPITSVRKLKEERTPPHQDLQEAITAVLLALPTHVQPPYLFMHETGCRPGEALTLHHDQVDKDEGVVLLRKTKAGRPRYLALTEEAMQAITAVPQVVGCPFVFYNPETLKCWKNSRYHWIKATKATGYPWLKPKDLRTGFAIRLADMGGIEKHVIQTLLGHASIRTTEAFYALHSQKKAVKRYMRLVKEQEKVVA